MTELENIFDRTARLPDGPCPLPDPKITGARAIEHVRLIRIEPQPEGYKYDDEDNNQETLRFVQDLKASFQAGKITMSQTKRILDDIVEGGEISEDEASKILKSLQD